MMPSTWCPAARAVRAPVVGRPSRGSTTSSRSRARRRRCCRCRRRPCRARAAAGGPPRSRTSAWTCATCAASVIVDHCSSDVHEAASPHMLHDESVRRCVRRALTSTLRCTVTSRSESERSGNGVAESAHIEVLLMRRGRPSPGSHPPPSCRFLAPMAALNAP